MKIISADYITSAVSAKQYPPGIFPEFAFVGRSNVGKSSLINSLVNRKKLVKTSSTPGKTQMINFFRINNLMMFADLPGYGYARVPAAVKNKWKKMIEHYLLNRETLVAVIFIIDIRRGFTDMDIDLKDWLEANGIGYFMVATKSDKLSQSEKHKQTKKIAATLRQGESVLLYSSKTSRGRKELWHQILSCAQQTATAKKGASPATTLKSS